MSAKPSHHLTPDELERVTELIYRRTGMVFGETKRYYMERRIFERIARSGASDFNEWLGRARNRTAELEALINAFTVNETYFFREENQLRTLSQDLLPQIAQTKGPGDRIRIWSVPCSTGEEPYSIAIWLLEHWPMVDAYHVEIIGSDIDTDALASARKGVFGARSLARLPREILEAYFETLADGERRLIEDLRESVTFTRGNLVDASSLVAQGAFDIIFCRNVLIYFDDASRARAIDNLYASLHPGGFICLGHTEFMTRISDRFETRRFPDGIVYQRPRS